MDTAVLVDDRIEDGARLLRQLAADGFDVSVGCWVKTAEEGLWFLYVGSRSLEVGGDKLADGYRTAYASWTKADAQSITLSDIKLVPASNPIAGAAMALRDRSRDGGPIRYQGSRRLGQMAVEEVYIYPADSPSLTVHAVTSAELTDGNLRVCKVAITMPADGSSPDPAEWVSDVRLSGGRLTVEKVQITRVGGRLTPAYREETHPLAPAPAEAAVAS